jgi:hypothetical protein
VIYILVVIFYFFACFKVIIGIGKNKNILIELGISSSAILTCQFCVLLFVIPIITPIFPLPVYISESVPIPLTVLFFLPAVFVAKHIKSKLPGGGYDYQRAALGKIQEVFWLAAAGAGCIFAVTIFRFAIGSLSSVA